MRSILVGVIIGAILPSLLATAGEFLRLRKQRRLAMRYLHRTMPVLHSER